MRASEKIKLETSWADEEMRLANLDDILERLSEMRADGLITIYENRLVVKESARMFVRNVCMAFDLKLAEAKPEGQVFSMMI